MTLAKYINEKQIERYKGFVIIDGVTYANNEAKAREVGFKELRIDEQPTYDEQTEWLDYEYEELKTIIKQHWIVREIEEVSE
jgi:hypothetical protein